MAYRHMAMPVHQAIDWDRAEFAVNSCFDPFSRPPPVNQADLEAIDTDNFLDRNVRRRRIHIATHYVYRVSVKDVEQIRGNQVPRMDYHIDRIKQIFHQFEKKRPSFCSIAKVCI